MNLKVLEYGPWSVQVDDAGILHWYYLKQKRVDVKNEQTVEYVVNASKNCVHWSVEAKWYFYDD